MDELFEIVEPAADRATSAAARPEARAPCSHRQRREIRDRPCGIMDGFETVVPGHFRRIAAATESPVAAAARVKFRVLARLLEPAAFVPELDYIPSCALPTPWAEFRLHGFSEGAAQKEHVALTLGDITTSAATADTGPFRVPHRGRTVQPALRLWCATRDGPAAHCRSRARHRAVPAPGRPWHRPGQQAPGIPAAGCGRRHGRCQSRAGLRARPARLPDRAPDARTAGRHCPAAADDQQSAQAGRDPRWWHRRGRTRVADRQPEPGERPVSRDQGDPPVALLRRPHPDGGLAAGRLPTGSRVHAAQRRSGYSCMPGCRRVDP